MPGKGEGMNERIIKHLAAKYVRYGLPFEELKTEATIGALEALKSFNPKKGASVDTWQYFCIKNRLKDVVAKEMQWNNHRFNSNVATTSQLKNHDFLQCNEMDDAERELIDTFPSAPHSVEVLQSLSEEAKRICHAIFNTPTEYASMMPKMARGKIVKKCREEFGWSWPKIWRTVNELKTAIK